MFKKIELFGFKSFADKLVIDFSSRVTCIVGPNGCGKSNISDAIRWVLGEQSSKALRGSNMQDVIFKGTDTRRQLSYCEVSLYFDNKTKIFPVEYSEVVLGRRLYRSGESEYYINKQACRLKDITTLLHDSGIDRDGLTIICQGQVTDVVNSKPEARREIFYDVAGIKKFKIRKEEAERKLVRVDGELLRVNDVITEIHRSLGPLQKQAENAKKYLELKERQKSLEINLFIHSYDNAASVKAELKREIKQVSTELASKQTQIENYTLNAAKALEELGGLDKRAEYIREQILSLSLGLERHKGEGKLVAERLGLLDAKNKEVEAEVNSINLRLDFEKQNLDKARELLASLERDREKVRQELVKSSALYEKAVSRNKTLEELKARRERLLAKKESGNMNFVVKRLLDARATDPMVKRNIIGVVGQELQVPQNLKLAIETALGGAAGNIITETEAHAKELIDYLKRGNIGRATFLPLTSARVRLLSYQDRMVLDEQYIVGIASELVTYDPKISNAVASLLGRIVVVEGLENAIDLSRKTQFSFKIVTLEGDVIEPRGSITGGGKSLQLEKELQSVLSEIKAIEEEGSLGEAHEKLTGLRIRDVALQSEIASVEKLVVGGQENLDLMTKSYEEKQTVLLGIEKEVELTKRLGAGEEEVKTYQDAVARLEKARSEAETFEAKKEELRDFIIKAEEAKTIAIDDARALHEKYYKTQAQLERADDEISTMQERIWEEYGLNYSACYQFKVEEFFVDSARIEISALRKEISKLGHVNVDAIEQSRESSERYESYTTQVNDLLIAKADLQKVIDDLSGEMNERFLTTFNRVNENFGTVFKELFGGGRAKLVLTDEVDFLNSGVEIIAEPPGKKLANLSLLSGGEKSLTAIALLFAILRLKPMPFVLLDEIEAALDEANVIRFTNYLKLLQSAQTQTQFIIITHKKQTMEMGDHLYGVTMEEKGVSKLVSVKLKEWASA